MKTLLTNKTIANKSLTTKGGIIECVGLVKPCAIVECVGLVKPSVMLHTTITAKG